MPVLEVRAADRRRPLRSQRRASARRGPRRCTSPSARCRSRRRTSAGRARCPRTPASGSAGSRRARRGAHLARDLLPERLLGREDVVRAARRLDARHARSSARNGLRCELGAERRLRPVARVDDRLGRDSGRASIRTEASERVPVGAGQVDAADGAREEQVAAEEAAVGVERDVRRRMPRDRDALELDARDVDRLAALEQVVRRVRATRHAGRRELGVALEPVALPSGMYTGAPVPSARSATPPTWSKWPCVIRIARTARALRASSSRSSARVAARVDDRRPRLAPRSRARRSSSSASGPEPVSVDDDATRASLAGHVYALRRRVTASRVQHWKLNEIETPDGTRRPSCSTRSKARAASC